jgi:hypothetical protein
MNAERELIRSALEDWDIAIIGGVRLPCIFDRLHEESLGVDGAAPAALVATGDILGSEALVTLIAGATELMIETIDGRVVGPFIFEGPEPGDPGTTLLRMSEK